MSGISEEISRRGKEGLEGNEWNERERERERKREKGG